MTHLSGYQLTKLALARAKYHTQRMVTYVPSSVKQFKAAQDKTQQTIPTEWREPAPKNKFSPRNRIQYPENSSNRERKWSRQAVNFRNPTQIGRGLQTGKRNKESHPGAAHIPRSKQKRPCGNQQQQPGWGNKSTAQISGYGWPDQDRSQL